MFNKFSIIVKCDLKNGISKNGEIPWLDTEHNDLKYFKQVTCEKKSILIMGKNTFNKLPSKFNKHNRQIVVISSSIKNEFELNNHELVNNIFNSLNDALIHCNVTSNKDYKIFVCGGTRLYNEAFYHQLCGGIYLSIINDNYGCDNYFNALNNIGKYYRCVKTDRYNRYYERIYEEEKYLFLMNNILKSPLKNNRTNDETYSKFAEQLRYSLTNDNNDLILPLVTSKKVSFSLIYSELLWFISGSTNINWLKSQNNHIWDANTSREFLDSQSLHHFDEGQLGAGYGFQWRNFGDDLRLLASDCCECNNIYDDPDECKCRRGVDQLSNVINSIKNEPFSRRHVITAWNPTQLSKVALPPCHLMIMFYVENPSSQYINESQESKNNLLELSCHVIMRSNDMFLGHPFNVGSYALLTHMIAHINNMKAKELVITMNDCHIYKSHSDKVKEQLLRECYGYPFIKFNRNISKIDDFKMDDINLTNYYCKDALKAKMIV